LDEIRPKKKVGRNPSKKNFFFFSFFFTYCGACATQPHQNRPVLATSCATPHIFFYLLILMYTASVDEVAVAILTFFCIFFFFASFFPTPHARSPLCRSSGEVQPTMVGTRASGLCDSSENPCTPEKPSTKGSGVDAGIDAGIDDLEKLRHRCAALERRADEETGKRRELEARLARLRELDAVAKARQWDLAEVGKTLGWESGTDFTFGAYFDGCYSSRPSPSSATGGHGPRKRRRTGGNFQRQLSPAAAGTRVLRIRGAAAGGDDINQEGGLESADEDSGNSKVRDRVVSDTPDVDSGGDEGSAAGDDGVHTDDTKVQSGEEPAGKRQTPPPGDESEPERMARLLCAGIADGSVPLIAAEDLAPLPSDFVDESNIDALVAIFNNHNDSLVGLKAVVQRGKALAALNALPGVKVARVKRAAEPERWVLTRWTGGAKNVGDKVHEDLKLSIEAGKRAHAITGRIERVCEKLGIAEGEALDLAARVDPDEIGVLLKRHDSKLNAHRLLYLHFVLIVEAVHRRVSAEVADSASVKADEEARAAAGAERLAADAAAGCQGVCVAGEARSYRARGRRVDGGCGLRELMSLKMVCC
jgi:hypothetical protein